MRAPWTRCSSSAMRMFVPHITGWFLTLQHEGGRRRAYRYKDVYTYRSIHPVQTSTATHIQSATLNRYKYVECNPQPLQICRVQPSTATNM